MNILDLKRKLLPMSGYQMGGGGSGGGGSTTSTSYQTNIPEYARSYVENMLMATQKQIYKPGTGTPQYEDVPIYEERPVFTGKGGATRTEKVQVGTERKLIPGSDIPSGDPESFQGYKAYGGTYDKEGKQLSYDPGKGIAGFQPSQIAAQQGITGLYDPVTGKLALGPDGKPINAGMQLPSEFGDASTGIKNLIGSKSAYTAPTNLGYTSSDATSQGYTSSDAAASAASAAKLGIAPTATAAQSAYAPTLQQYQMGGPDKVATRSFTDKGTAESYMSPYMANVLDIQNKELERQAGIASSVRGAQAAKAGAFGGSRQGIENAEANRNLAMMKNANAAQGMQQAYGQAMQQFNAEQGYGLQGQIANQQAGLTVGQQNLGANLGVQQLGTQTGTQMALANLSNEQQTALANQALKGQYGLTQGQFDQGANMQTSAQAQQAALANAAAKSAASQFGAASSNQAALANAAAKNAAAQFGASQNLASAQTAAQYGLAADQLSLQAAGQLGALGSQELQAQQGIYGLQNQIGAQQQALEQQKLNQAMQDYANEQQYPLMQLGTMSNMLRGLPMQAQTTQQYQAQPNVLTQAIGAAGTGAALYNAFNPSKTGASGGLPSEFKYSKGGGIMSYDIGGEIESDLESMDEEGLQKQLKESSSPSVKRIAQRILRERQMSKQAQGTGPMGVQYQAPAMAGGGIIAFRESTEENNQSLVEEKPELTAGQMLQQRVMQNKPTGDVMTQPQGIVQAAPTPPVPAPKVEDTLGNLPPFYKSMYEKANATSNQSRQQIAADLEKEAGPNVGAQEQRAKVMAERANTEDEAHRTKYLRLAEFFASWGSTPGNTLVAGMTAFRNKVPDVISDEKEAKKIRMEIDKSIAALDEATRLEKKGYMDKAESIKEKQAANMMKVNEFVAKAQEDQVKIAAENKKQADYLLGQAQIHREDALSRATTSKEVAEIEGRFRKETENIRGSFGIREANIRAKSQEKSDTSRERHYDQSSVDRLLGEERKAQSDIDRIKKDPDVSMNMRILEMAKDPKNNISPEQVAIAKKLLEEKLGDAPSRLEGIRTERQRIQDRLAGKKPSDAPANDPLGIL